MSEERDKSAPDQRPDHDHARSAANSSKDLSPFFKGWDYEPGTINVRKIYGLDGAPKVQMRVELGILQMELEGRPDGARPHGCESLLEYFEEQLEDHRKRNGNELGFHLNRAQCEELREEAQLYYRRYLSLFVLEDFGGVVRDTARNLRVLDFCGKFALEDNDRVVLEQFRPYILMMNARAMASIEFKAKRYAEALKILTDTLDTIRAFFTAVGQPDAYAQSSEVRLLRRFAREIRAKLPVDPLQKMRDQLERAVKDEQYEEAARLRDEIRRRSESKAS